MNIIIIRPEHLRHTDLRRTPLLWPKHNAKHHSLTDLSDDPVYVCKWRMRCFFYSTFLLFLSIQGAFYLTFKRIHSILPKDTFADCSRLGLGMGIV